MGWPGPGILAICHCGQGVGWVVGIRCVAVGKPAQITPGAPGGEVSFRHGREYEAIRCREYEAIRYWQADLLSEKRFNEHGYLCQGGAWHRGRRNESKGNEEQP